MVYTAELKQQVTETVNKLIEKDTVDLADGIVGVFRIIWKLQGNTNIPVEDENKIKELILGINRLGYNRGVEDAKGLLLPLI